MALFLGTAPAVMTLKVLNSFSFAAVATPWADGVSLSFSDAWNELERRLQSQTTPQIATEARAKRLVSDVLAQYRPVGKAKRRRKRHK